MISVNVNRQVRLQGTRLPSYDESLRYKWESPGDGTWSGRILRWLQPIWFTSKELELPFNPLAFMWLRYVLTPQGSTLSHPGVWFEVES